MKKYQLKKEDLYKIEALIKVTTSIDDIYTKLFNLEIEEKKDTDEYRKMIYYLNIMKEEENKLYDESNLFTEKCLAWLDYLLATKISKNFLSDFQSISVQNYENRVIRRISNILTKKIVDNPDNIKQILHVIKGSNRSHPKQLNNKSIHSSIETEKSIEKDFLNAYLSLLREFINDPNYNNFKVQLINSKYNMIYINKDWEDDMINNNFNILSELYINSRFIADLNQVSLELYKRLKDLYTTKISKSQIQQFIKINDIQYNNSKIAVEAILRQCFIRASFILMSDESIADINFEFHELIENNKYLNEHPNDKISSQLIINCFNSIKQDKNKQIIFSLKYK